MFWHIHKFNKWAVVGSTQDRSCVKCGLYESIEFHVHEWDRWTDWTLTNFRVYSDGEKSTRSNVTYQERRCKTCNYMELRFVGRIGKDD